MLITTDTNEKHQRILYAAARIFARKGFHRAKMEEIACEADMGKGTLYEYFPSKEQLFHDMIKTGKTYYLGEMACRIEAGHGVAAQLKKAVYWHLSFMKEHRDIARAMMQDCLNLGSEVHHEFMEIYHGEVALIAAVLKKGVAEGTFRTLDAERVASALYGAVHGAGGNLIFLEKEKDLEEECEELVTLFLLGIGRDGAKDGGKDGGKDDGKGEKKAEGMK